MRKTANAIYAGSCSVDLSAAMLVLCFYYDVYISSYKELIILLFYFSDKICFEF